MEERRISTEQITAFGKYLHAEERSAGTIEKYLRDVKVFTAWLNGRSVTKETITEWKENLLEQQYAPVTINSMLAAINTFFHFMDWKECRAKFLKIQRQMFREQSRELTRGEYNRLLKTARSLGWKRLELLMETICATGIRVSEVQYITVEAAQKGKAQIDLKGKIRTILLPSKLSKKLIKYAKHKKIASGEIFLTRSGKSLSRKQIWMEMKRLCRHADVPESKVFPHNLRHLFATTFYKACKDIVRLADVLGHSNVETTRIYLLTTGQEHIYQLDRLGLIL
ncbi:MAG: tyrosine-type recombinase/integrase [Clostridia bacterium]|nr:tyrosine-type recombinase/integrase [Clostridia bacterium]